jgi:hypothetical protein
MNTIRKITCTIIAALAAMFSTARADMASGTYTMEFADTTSLWDVSGTYSQDIGGLAVEYTLSVDPGGKITGYGSADYSLGYYGSIYIDFDFAGTCKSSGGVTRISMSWKMSGTGSISDYAFNFGAAVKSDFEIDQAACTMVGTMSGKIKVSVDGYGSQSVAIPPTTVELYLPAEMTGSWDLDMDLSTVGNKTSGTGHVTLSNGSVYDMTASGSYKASTDRTKLTFKGLPVNRAMSVATDATFLPATPGYEKEVRCNSLKGKALGQSLIYSGGL